MHLVQAFNFVKAGLLRSLRILRAKLGASPFFLRYVVLSQEKNFHVRIGVDEQRGAGLQPSGEVKEIIVLAKAVKIIRPFSFSGSKQDESAAFHLFSQRHTAGAIVRIVLALSCVGANAEKNDRRTHKQR